MKPIQEVYPEYAKDEQHGYFYGPGDYNPLLQSFGVEILLQVDDDDYQGDTRLILRDGDRYGLLIFGWGSCSGCDALQGCESMQEVDQLRQSLFDGIKWDSLQGLLDYITNKDWELEYCWHHEETKEFVRQSIDLLKDQIDNPRTLA